MRIILEHQNQVASDMANLSIVQRVLFLCAVCQRQISVYEKFSAGHSWDNHAELKVLMNDCWDWAVSLGKASKPSEPIPEQFIDIDFDQSSSGLAVEAFSSVEYLAYLIVSESSDVSVPPVEYAFTILDSYLYEKLELPVSKEGDQLVDTSELVVQEMKRQNEQLSMVSSIDWQLEDWTNFRKEVEIQSLLN
jgi:hypothetical protein